MDSTTQTAALLRAVAAGRREYAQGMSEDEPRQAADRELLLHEAGAFDAAARIVEGDFGPLYDWLPTWRWTAAMEKRVLADASDDTTVDDVAALGVEA